jgi:hypothetical protein
MMRSDRNLSAGTLLAYVLVGAAAGVVATFVMGKATTAMYESEPARVRAREDEARGGTPAYDRAAEKGAKLLGRETLTKRERKRWGARIHWALGIGAGAVYGAWFALGPQATVARALGYGTGFYLLFDELLNWALGLTPGPRAFPWQTHARGLAGHLVHGLTTHAVVRALDQRARAWGIVAEA